MKKRAEYRNEVKTRLDCDTYDALQEFKQLNFIDSDSAAVARICRIALRGMVPSVRSAVSADAGRIDQLE
jgi:hypothetical protein